MSPWFGEAQVGRRRPVTSASLLPTTSWWVDAADFYAAARAQLPRLLEAGGRELVARAKASAA